MIKENHSLPGSQRVQHNRMRNALNRLKRVEVKVSEKDEWIIRAMAEALKDNKEGTCAIRQALCELLPSDPAQSLADFFQRSPLAEAAAVLEIERTKETGSPLVF
ncbi:MAG: hypothetical protein KTR20_14295 [Cellvibrionaceae bacterium]|nr:hypothetical protein [Cellvibrionaceae bacterium]